MKTRIRPWCGHLLVLLVAAGVGAACNGSGAQVPADGSLGADAPAERDDTGADAGTAGGAGSGGAGGNSGVAGTGGAGFSGSFQPPGCLRDLFAACSIAGPCVYRADDAGTPLSRCYASGARSVAMGSRCSTVGASIETIVVTKPDGAPCYTLSISANVAQACEVETYRWSDANGASVATGLQNSGGITIRCEVGGETATRSGIQPYLIFGPDQCSPGNCP